MRWLIALLLVCLLAGCDGEPTRETRLVLLAGSPFVIGPPERFAEHRVYTDLRHTHGVWIVSRDSASGTMIVVLDARTPDTDTGPGTRYNTLTGRFECPVTGSRFTRDGLLAGTDGRATRSLERLRVELVRGELRVDPDQRFSHEDHDWSNPLSMHILGSETHPDQLEPGPRSPHAPNLRPTHGLQ